MSSDQASTGQFDLQPTLVGNLLKLRPLEASDFEQLYAAASDPLIWELHPEKHRYKREVFEVFFEGAMNSRGALVAVDKQNDQIIGSSRFCGYYSTHQRIEVGYTFLNREYWGGVYNREMKALMLNHAFQFVREVVFFIGENNLRSRKAIKKIGAVLVDRVERQPLEGPKYSSVVYKIEKHLCLLK